MPVIHDRYPCVRRDRRAYRYRRPRRARHPRPAHGDPHSPRAGIHRRRDFGGDPRRRGNTIE